MLESPTFVGLGRQEGEDRVEPEANHGGAGFQVISVLLNNLRKTGTEGRSREIRAKCSQPGVALTHISACTTHKNLAVRKIMEAMRTAYTKSGTRSQRASNYARGKRSRKAREYCERKARIVCEQHFISLNRLMNPVEKSAFEMRHSCLYFLSLVRIYEFSYANFSPTRVRCTHLLKS